MSQSPIKPSSSERSSLASLEDALENMRQLGLAVPVWERPVTPFEVQYFLDRWPFLQVISTNELPILEEAQVLTAPNSWVVLSYGDAMASSPGQFLFGAASPQAGHRVDQDGEGDVTSVPALTGTVWRQAYETCLFMAKMARDLGWEGVYIVDGHPMMKWAIWMAALDHSLTIDGFSPSEQDKERRERVKRSIAEDLKRLQIK